MKSGDFFLFLGEADREGVTAKLRALKTRYVKKRLESRLENWTTILSLVRDVHLVGIVAKLSTNSFHLMASDTYIGATKNLFENIGSKPNIIFIHESFFHPGENETLSDDVDGEYYSLFFGEVSEEIRGKIKQAIFAPNINIVTYRRNAEITVLADEFVDQHARNIIFRIYVPNGRIWAKEAERLLDLFRDYLFNVGGFGVRQEQYKTGRGVVYEFIGDENLTTASLPTEFQHFSNFVDLCVANPSQANTFLEGGSLDSRQIGEIVDRYAKEARRLQVDLKQERERRVLSIRHRMEAELVDVVSDDRDWNKLNALIEMQVPQLSGLGVALGFSPSSANNNSYGNITVNIKPQFVSAVNSIITKEISGTQNISPEASELLGLIKSHGGTRAAELTSAVYELEDPDSKAVTRQSAGAKIKSFLHFSAGKVADIGIGVLQTYIEHKLGL